MPGTGSGIGFNGLVWSMFPINLVIAGAAMMFLAGLVRGFTGFGMGIVAVPFLSIIMPPDDAVVVVLLLQVFVSLANLSISWKLCNWSLVNMLIVGTVIATPLGSWALLYLPANAMRICIVIIVLATAITLLAGFRLKIIPSRPHIVVLGLVSGILNGLAGMSGPPVVAFFLASPLSVPVARASMIIFFMISSVLALIPLTIFGRFHLWSLAASLGGLPVVLFGSTIGAKFYLTSREGHFRFVSIGVLVLAALLAGLRAFGSFAA